MADGELPGSLPPRLHAHPRHARRPRLRLAMGHAHEGHGTDGLDDRPPLRDRLREARPEQAALETDDGSFREAEGWRAATEFVLIVYPSSWPGLSRPSTSFSQGVPKTWMPGT